MTEAAAPPSPDRSRRLYVYWGVALGLLIALSLTLWLVILPMLQARAAVTRCRLHNKSVGHKDRKVALREIESLGGPAAAVACLRSYLRLPERLSAHRPTTIWMLGYCGERAVPELLVRLNNAADDQERIEAARALGRTGAKEAVGALSKALADRNDVVRMAATEALGSIGTRAAIDLLVEVLERGEDDPWVLCTAATSLGLIGNSRAIAPLVKALDKETDIVSEGAALALGDIGGPRVVKPLAAALRSRDADIRKSAAEALGKVGDPTAIRPLTEALKDHVEGVRDAAAGALAAIRGKIPKK